MPIDDSAVENALRPVAMGRTSRLHLGIDHGGRTAAVLMSLVQSSQGWGKESIPPCSPSGIMGDGPPPRDSRAVEASSVFAAMA